MPLAPGMILPTQTIPTPLESLSTPAGKHPSTWLESIHTVQPGASATHLVARIPLSELLHPRMCHCAEPMGCDVPGMETGVMDYPDIRPIDAYGTMPASATSYSI